MNLAYLEFIGAIEIDRTPVAVNPAISFDKPIGKKSRKQYTYSDIRQHKTINDLEEELRRKKEEQKEAIRYVYNELVKLTHKYNSKLTMGYINDAFKNQKLPAYIIRSGGKFKDITDDYARGDVLFCHDKIVLFMDYLNYDFLIALGKKYSKDIFIDKNSLGKYIEVHISMKEYLK